MFRLLQSYHPFLSLITWSLPLTAWTLQLTAWTLPLTAWTLPLTAWILPHTTNFADDLYKLLFVVFIIKLINIFKKIKMILIKLI